MKRARRAPANDQGEDMDKLGKLDLAGVLSLGVVAAGLLAGWIATSAGVAAQHEAKRAREAVTLTADGRMKVTVTGKGSVPTPVRAAGTAVAGAASLPAI